MPLARLARLPLASRIGRWDVAAIAAAALLSAASSILAVSAALRAAALAAIPPVGLRARLVSAPSLEQLAKPTLNPETLAGNMAELLPGICSRGYWAYAAALAAASAVLLYPFLSKVVQQLPVLLYRLATTPARLSAAAAALSTAAALPVTLQPLAAAALIGAAYRLEPSPATDPRCLALAVSTAEIPLVQALAYTATGRYDFTLVLSLLLAVKTGALAAGHMLLDQAATLAAAAGLLAYTSRSRWATL